MTLMCFIFIFEVVVVVAIVKGKGGITHTFLCFGLSETIWMCDEGRVKEPEKTSTNRQLKLESYIRAK
jgi:hypothetical protein